MNIQWISGNASASIAARVERLGGATRGFKPNSQKQPSKMAIESLRTELLFFSSSDEIKLNISGISFSSKNGISIFEAFAPIFHLIYLFIELAQDLDGEIMKKLQGCIF